MNLNTITLLTISLLVSLSIPAQKRNPHNPENLGIDWQFVTNNFQQESKSSAILLLTNHDKKKALPPGGWVIYFNAVRDIVQKDAGHGIEIGRVHGDLFQIRPGSGFKGLQPGASIPLDYISEFWINNYTEAPSGFYLVWNSSPAQAYPISKLTISPPADPGKFQTSVTDKPGHVTPSLIFNQNKTIIDIPENKLTKVFPTPLTYQVKEGVYQLNANCTISTDTNFRKEAAFLSGELLEVFGKEPVSKATGSSNIHLRFDEKLKPEAYTLSVSPAGIVISAAEPAGMFYGIQSFKCLFPLEAWKGKLPGMSIPLVEITDAPRFGYRGLHVDVARNFQSKAEIIRVIKWMAMYKLNVLHFHFSDDEGWRIEIPGLPELTTVGVKRGHTLDSKNKLPPTYGSGGPVNQLQSGYYTRNDYIEILRFATSQHIEVIPEIETPGHARAAIKSMLARYERLMAAGNTVEAGRYLLNDLGDQSTYKSVQHYTDNIMCVGLPSVYSFIEKVLDEIIAMHVEAGNPLKTIHMGGDEVPSGVWEKSPVCQALLQKNPGYKNAAGLWMYYWKKVNELVASRGLTVSGWEEIGMRPTILDNNKTMMVNPEFANAGFRTYVWNNVIGFGSEDLPYRLANGGYKVVLCPVSNLYFDLAYEKDFMEPGYYWGGFIDVDKPFYFIPYDYYKNTKVDKSGNPVDPSIFAGKDRLTDYGKENILGIQGHLWSENITSPQLLEYQAFPKLLGLAERAWATDPEWATIKDKVKSESLYQNAWNEFVNITGKRELTKLAWYQGGAQFRIPTVGAILENGAVVANIQLPGLQIRYTIDGSTPGSNSRLYTGPVKEKGTIVVRAFDDRGRGGRVTKIENK